MPTIHQTPGSGEQDLEPTRVGKSGPSGLGRKITQRVKPQITRSQINSAPPNTAQSSLVTACWTGGSSLALISQASVLGQAAIFHGLKTDDPRVGEMKAPFNRSARGSAGEGGRGSVQMLCPCQDRPRARALEAQDMRLAPQHPGSGPRDRIRVTISPRICPQESSQAGGGPWRPYLHSASHDASLQPGVAGGF